MYSLYYFGRSGGKNGEAGAYNALKKLLSSGIPGLENLFGQGNEVEKWITLISSLSCICKLSHYVATTGARKLAMENPFSDLTKALDITFSGTFRMNKQ